MSISIVVTITGNEQDGVDIAIQPPTRSPRSEEGGRHMVIAHGIHGVLAAIVAMLDSNLKTGGNNG